MGNTVKIHVDYPGDRREDLIIKFEDVEFKHLAKDFNPSELETIDDNMKIVYPLLQLIGTNQAVVFCGSLLLANQLCNYINAMHEKNIAIVSTRFSLKLRKFDIRDYFPTHQIVMFGRTGDSVITMDESTVSVKLEVA